MGYLQDNFQKVNTVLGAMKMIKPRMVFELPRADIGGFIVDKNNVWLSETMDNMGVKQAERADFVRALAERAQGLDGFRADISNDKITIALE